MAGQKLISPSDPDRADHRMISYLMRIHLRNKGVLNDKVYARVVKVFNKAGGSWVNLFKGSFEDLNLLKKILKIGIKDGVIPKREKKARLEKAAGGKGLLELFEDPEFKIEIEFSTRRVFVRLKRGNQILGYVNALKGSLWCLDQWTVSSSKVVGSREGKKWGPFLYEILLEVVGKEGVTSDREEVSSSARNVWRYYFENRPDIKKVPFDWTSCKEHNQDYLNYKYIKPRKTILKWLQKNNRLVIKGGSVKIATAKSIRDLIQENLFVDVLKRDSYCSIYLITQKEGKDYPFGQIHAQKIKRCNDNWVITHVTSPKGWGPFLYDLLMEFLKTGLSPDRYKVSPSAQRVWKFYYENRPDIIKSPLISCRLHGVAFLDQVYQKPRKILLKALTAKNKIRYR